MLGIFHQSTDNEVAQIGWNSSIFVLHSYQGFIKQKCQGGVPRLRETIKSHWSWLPTSQMKGDKAPWYAFTAELVELSQF